jgi:hypothetical protein
MKSKFLVGALCAFSVNVSAGIILGEELAELTVFSNTYTTIEANSIVYGSMLGGDVSTTGANAIVHGDYTSVNATNVGGGTSKVYGNVVSGGVLTVGGATGGTVPGPEVTGSVTSTGASTIGAYAQVGGDMLSGDVATTGANSVVGAGVNGGSVLSNGAATTGDTAIVHGDVWSGNFSTIGVNSTVTGNLDGVNANVISTSATVGSENDVTTQPDLSAVRTDVLAEAQKVTNAQTELFNMGFGTTLAATMTVDTTLYSGIYSAASFSTTAGTTLTLDGLGLDDQSWVFNIADILAFGGVSTIEVINVGANASVYWNSYNGYITSGDGSDVIGTLLADTYIMVGANATVSNIGTSCGAVYSATSYVTAGDSAEIGGLGCSASVTSVPEPESFGMLLAALTLFGFKRSRKA